MVVLAERRSSRSALWASRLASFSAVLFVVSALGHRLGLIETVGLFWLLGLVAMLAVVAIGLSVVVIDAAPEADGTIEVKPPRYVEPELELEPRVRVCEPARVLRLGPALRHGARMIGIAPLRRKFLFYRPMTPFPPLLLASTSPHRQGWL